MTAARIANTLKAEILNGLLRPGEELSQVAIADRFSVSRIPVRDALSMLSQWGLAEVVPRRSAHVRALTRDEVHECFELRILLECDIYARAINRATQEDWTQIDRVRRQSDIDAEGKNWLDADVAFHMSLYAPAKRHWQIAMIENLLMICQAQIASYLGQKSAPPEWLADHAAICEAGQEKRTDDAKQLLKAHLERIRAKLLDEME